jgi:hypothetical protein
MEATCSPKRLLAYNRLHGVIPQNTELFITTAVRTSNPTCLYIISNMTQNHVHSNAGYTIFPTGAPEYYNTFTEQNINRTTYPALKNLMIVSCCINDMSAFCHPWVCIRLTATCKTDQNTLVSFSLSKFCIKKSPRDALRTICFYIKGLELIQKLSGRNCRDKQPQNMLRVPLTR